MLERDLSFEDWFEEMAVLARENPELFEKKRQELISETISQASPENRERLKRFQWRIDREIERAKTPLGSCIRLYDMLMEMVYGEGGFLEAVETLRDLLTQVQEGKNPDQSSPKSLRANTRQAQVIPFPKKTS